MPLETATYLSQLVTSNPANSDGLNQADDHMRLIKATVKATFPNFTAAALTSTQAQLDAAALAVNTNGVAILADAGVHFKTNTTDGITNPSAGEIDISLAGVAQLRVNAGGLIVPGAIAATGAITGPGSCPIGGGLLWFTDTLPTGSGTWAWANGTAISRTTYATLFGLWGTTYGAGDGSTTFNLINMQEITPVGKSTMGGAASPGLLASVSGGVKTVLGSLFGADTHTLTTTEMPVHYHGASIYDPTHSHTYTASALGGGTGSTPNYFYSSVSGGTATSSDGTGVRVNSTNGLDKTESAGSGTAHSILQPSRVVNYIVRIA